MDRLDETINNVGRILDWLITLREIYQSGSCNDCGQAKTCVCRPDPGEQVRYNCPFYMEDDEPCS